MEINESLSRRLSELKEVKFQIPMRQHVNLHSYKLIMNQSISETVAAALKEFFDAQEGASAASAEAAA
jgi:hypothetical protein